MKRVLIALSLTLAMGGTTVFAATNISLASNVSPAVNVPAAGNMDPAAAEKQLEGIEKQYFQHTFLNESVDHRLTRVEKFTFGESYKGSTISRLQRLAATLTSSPAQLEDAEDAPRPARSSRAAAPGRTATTGAGQNTAPSGQGSTPAAASTGESYPHVTFLENEILHQSFDGQPLEDRLARLETKTFGVPSQNPDLSARTDALERFAETRLHKPAFQQHEDPYDDGGSNFPSGFSSAPSHSNIIADERQMENEEARAPVPPTDHARMLARVAWCEQHLFGRTFPDMHLLPRLHQLNARLFPKDREPDVQLMDRMDLIVKTVVLQQHPAQVTQ